MMRRIFLATGVAILGLSLSAATGAAREPDIPYPPDAHMSVDDRDVIKGTLGSFCYFEAQEGGCGDIGEALVLDESFFSGGEELTFSLGDDARMGRWFIAYSRYPDGPVETRYESQAPHPDVEVVSVIGPPAGDWRISLLTELTTAVGEGDATYEWRLSSMPDTSTGLPADGSSLWITWFVIPGVFLASMATLALHRRRRAGDR
ncbi:MAG: hypothetical protein M3395_09670 [Chloroflexota bacterium]|nr:hypothetical protein [Chloroflexota bacterium]